MITIICHKHIMCLYHHFRDICCWLNFSICFSSDCYFVRYVTLAIQHHRQRMHGSWFGMLLAMDVCSHVESITNIAVTVECGLHDLRVCNYLSVCACITTTTNWQQQKLVFYGPLAETTRVNRYQKKHSPIRTYPDHQPSFISFL